MIDRSLGDAFGVWSCPVWSTVLQCGARLPIRETYWTVHLNLLDRVVSGTCCLTGGLFECDIAHRRSVTVLCMLYKIMCNPMHDPYGALPAPYVPVRVTRGALAAQRVLSTEDHYSLLSVSVKRSDGPSIRWCGTGPMLFLLVLPA